MIEIMKATDHNKENGFWTCWSIRKAAEQRAVIHLQGGDKKTLCGINHERYMWEFEAVEAADFDTYSIDCARCRKIFLTAGNGTTETT